MVREQVLRWIRPVLVYSMRAWKRLKQYHVFQWMIGKHPMITMTHDEPRKKKYEVRYWIDNRPYIMCIEPRRGPCPYRKIEYIPRSGGHTEDVRDDVLPYMGPAFDFHGRGHIYRPIDLGFDGSIAFTKSGSNLITLIQSHQTFAPILLKEH